MRSATPKRAAICSLVALAREAAERHDLVRRVHGDAHGVLGERGLGGGVAVDDEARHRVVLGDVLVGRERVQGAQSARAGRDAEQRLAARGDDEVLEQPVGADRGDELGVGLGRCRVGGLPARPRALRSSWRSLLSGMSRVSGEAAVAVAFCMEVSLVA